VRTNSPPTAQRTSDAVRGDGRLGPDLLLDKVHQLPPPRLKAVDAVGGGTPGVRLVAIAVAQQVDGERPVGLTEHGRVLAPVVAVAAKAVHHQHRGAGVAAALVAYFVALPGPVAVCLLWVCQGCECCECCAV